MTTQFQVCKEPTMKKILDYHMHCSSKIFVLYYVMLCYVMLRYIMLHFII